MFVVMWPGVPCSPAGSKWHGVNYGNRFIPEDWMKHPYNFFGGVRKNARRVALWDVHGPGAKQRMLQWLDATICESHFKEMQRCGVEVLRVPCGYWNWVTYEGNCGPEVPSNYSSLGERLKNLHRIASPRDYRIYFDKIFDFAGKYGIKVLLDLHALPGSQNGEIHSGVCIEEEEEHIGFVQSEANLQTSVRAVRAMAEFASQKPNLFGIQVISEPHLHTDEGHEFLRRYYQQAILAARESLDPSVPVVLFEWTYEMHRWEEGAFPESTYGRVVWDTHLYHFPEPGQKWTSKENGLEKAKEAYAWDLQQLRHFSRAQGEIVFVGEFSLAGPSLNRAETREFAQWLVDQFDFACAGSLLWSFDNSIIAWSMQRQVQEWGVDWRSILRGDHDRTVEHPPIKIEAAPFGTWLTATEKGAVQADAPEPSWWEEWVPYSYSVDGKSKVALRSAAHGTWLSVTQDGEVIQSDHRSAWEEFSVLFRDKQDGRQCISLQSFHGSWLAVRRFRPTDRLLLSAAHSIHDAEVTTAWLLA
ncbi:exgA [Symbiodinium pilosum]|uniref:ExgA protein n=1 Tax=Symbiodinium pilosum TaxID=2952 RepID=A0A812L239_SYMPI|nr:exgA [Symbiodinium pilosum]